jgi:hypothetical protein
MGNQGPKTNPKTHQRWVWGCLEPNYVQIQGKDQRLRRNGTIMYQRWKRMLGIVILVVIFGIGVVSLAQVSKEKIQRNIGKSLYGDAVVETKVLSGEVVGFSPRNDPNYIGIALEGTDTDYYFILDDNVKLVRKNSLSDIQIGDTVEITFHKIKRKTKEGREVREHRAKIVRFLRPKLKGALIGK